MAERDLRSLGTEMLGILWHQHLVRTIPSHAGDAMANMRENAFQALLMRDIMLSLCKFSDASRQVLSFERAYKQWRRPAMTDEARRALEVQIAEYRQLTTSLAKHRNNYIAHLSRELPAGLPVPLEVDAATRLALEIVDVLTGAVNEYHLLDLDLRAIFRAQAA